MSVQFCLSIENAKTKWCPWAQSRVIKFTTEEKKLVEASCIGAGAPEPSVNCISDACMAWRFVETHIPDEAGNLTVKSGDTHGFCGLAGIPMGAGA